MHDLLPHCLTRTGRLFQEHIKTERRANSFIIFYMLRWNKKKERKHNQHTESAHTWKSPLSHLFLRLLNFPDILNYVILYDTFVIFSLVFNCRTNVHIDRCLSYRLVFFLHGRTVATSNAFFLLWFSFKETNVYYYYYYYFLENWESSLWMKCPLCVIRL